MTGSTFLPLRSAAVVLARDDIDTDQIIPARFLTTTGRAGLGRWLFADWRYDAAGAPRPDFVLNDALASAAQVLVAGRNFGCGSSREHAPWALLDFGFRAVIAPSFADIFAANALKVGLLPVMLGQEAHAAVVAALARDPRQIMDVDIARQSVTLPDGSSFGFAIDAFAKRCLLRGEDTLAFLLSARRDIAAFEQANPGRIDTRVRVRTAS